MYLTDNPQPLSVTNSVLQYRPIPQRTHFSLADTFLLWRYQLKVLNKWLLGLVGLGFGVCAAILWLQLGKGAAASSSNAAQQSRFVMESMVGLVAGLLASSLIMEDPALEVIMITRSGIGKVTAGRFLLSFGLLLVYSTLYLLWSLFNGIIYAKEQNPLFFLLMWLTPTVIVSMLALFGSLLTRNRALGLVMGLIPLIGALFLQMYLLPVQPLHPFFIPYTLTSYDAPDWWVNRLTLLAIGLGLATLNWRLVGQEERLLVG